MKFILLSLQLRQVRGGTILQYRRPPAIVSRKVELLASLFDTDVQSAADRIERASLVSHEHKRRGQRAALRSKTGVRIPPSPPIILTITGSYQPAGRPTSHLLSNPNTRFANGMQTPLSGNVLSRDPAHRGDEDAMRLEIPSASSRLLGRVLINRDW
jgi:hypothetical protein